MKRVLDFLKKAEVYYLATVEGDQPRGQALHTDRQGQAHLKAARGKF